VVPVADGSDGVTVSCSDGVAADEELPWLLDDEELGEGGTGPIAVIVPGVVEFDGRVIVTGSPTLTVGALVGSSGTVTVLVVVVT
jgi:hypothetical protein